MTIDEIKAELRRSACEDECPFYGIRRDAFRVATGWKECFDGWVFDLSDDDCRTFFLLVAEAL